MDIAIRDFCATITDDDCVLIYFSGHGMEAKGKNYLVPIENIRDPVFDCINLEELLKQLNNCGDNLLNIIILDACRADKENDTWKTKATSAENEHKLKPAFGKALSGHVRLPNQSQFALIYSADPGTVSFAAGRHTNGNSYFTHSLLNHISTPNITLEDMMRGVSREIRSESEQKQRPWTNSCLHEAFYFNKDGVQTKKDKFQQFGITVAGGNGYGQELNQLAYPHGIFIDNDNSIYIADSKNGRIVKWRLNSNTGQIIAGGNGRGNENNQFNFPKNIIFDKENSSFIVSDHFNSRVIRCFDQSQTNQQIIISNIDCVGLAIDKNGFIYVSDHKNHEVRRWKMGEYKKEGIIVAGGNGQGNHLNQLNQPTYIFIDKDYSLYISDEQNHRVMKWRKDAKEGIIVAGGNGQGNSLKQLNYPHGVIVDNLGQIYVVDYWNDRVMRWCEGNEEGEIVVGGNGQGNQSNQLHFPTGLSFDTEQNLYVVDRFNDRIQKYDRILN
ncbi:unnamed protein product [Adineta steineri]|uniref:Peptidase C14 caspase domain-containing protein n=1 Tax=Adineta steineri TaxID=433720 RepID=A0A814AGS1_9BILA|nr:unnamed protein product [Adineta steineri]CAF0913401.1 unnamed protein product [Adineta steineri]